jgi:hypothetical protein
MSISDPNNRSDRYLSSTVDSKGVVRTKIGQPKLSVVQEEVELGKI